MGLPGKNWSAVGLDIGNYAIKSVEMDTDGDKMRLKRVWILPNDPSKPEAVGTALKLIFGEHPAAAKHVRVSMSGGSSLLIRRIQLPTMSQTDLKGAIRFEAESHIPFPVDDCQIDFQILNQTPDKKTMNVLLVAAKKDFIRERLKLLSTNNIVPEIIDVDIFCLINAYEMLGQELSEMTFGLLNIGHQVSSFAIIHEKQPFFVRDIPFGGLGVTQAVMEARSMDEAEADRWKMERTEETLPVLRAAAEKGFDALIDEMRHSIDYFENETGEEIKTIHLSGGGALCPGTPEVFSAELGKHISLWDNTKKLEIFGEIDQNYLKEHSSELNVALGMVMRGHKKK